MMKSKEDKNMADTQLLEAAKVAYAFTDILDDDYITFKRMREVIAKIFLEDDVTDSWLTNIERWERLDISPWDKPNLIPEFRKEATIQYQLVRDYPPNLSGVGLMHFSTQKSRASRQFLEIVSPQAPRRASPRTSRGYERCKGLDRACSARPHDLSLLLSACRTIGL